MMRMSELFSQQLKPKQIIDRVVAETGCSESAAWVTWRTRGTWMPKLVNIQEDIGSNMTALLNDMREIRRLSMNLYYQAGGNPSARVGALGKALDAVKAEAQLRTQIGQIAPETHKMEVKVEANGFIEAFVRDGDVLFKELLRRRLDPTRQAVPEDSPE